MARDKEKAAECQRRYLDKNKARVAERNRIYQEKNKEKISAYRRIYLEKNREKTLERGRIYNEKNKEKRKEYRIIYNEKNKEKISDRWKKDIDDLSPRYISNLLGIKREDTPKEIIDLKRLQVLRHRTIRTIKQHIQGE